MCAIRAILVGLSMLVLPARLVAVQDATPPTFPITPDPAECRVAPRPIAFYAAYLGTPSARPVVPPGNSLPEFFALLDTGQPADAETVAAVVTVMHEYVACANAGDFGRELALWDDDVMRKVVELVGVPQEVLDEIAATPIPLASADRATILDIRDVEVLADGRVSARVTTSRPFRDPSNDPEAIFLFVRTHEGLRISDLITFPGIPTATPSS